MTVLITHRFSLLVCLLVCEQDGFLQEEEDDEEEHNEAIEDIEDNIDTDQEEEQDTDHMSWASSSNVYVFCYSRVPTLPGKPGILPFSFPGLEFAQKVVKPGILT